MSNPVLIKNRVAEAEVSPYRIVKHGAADHEVLHAALSTDAMYGVTGELGADVGERVDVVVAGLVDVEYGGDVIRGDTLTSMAGGKAVAVAAGAAQDTRVMGYADVSGALDDIGSMHLHQSRGALSEMDPVFEASAAAGIEASDITNWDAAHGWGDHSTEGYLVSENAPLAIPVLDLSGTAVYRAVAPVAGIIAKLWSVLDAALAVGDAVITFAINGTPVTDGAITITQAGSAPGDVDSATPSAANAVVAGDVVEATVSGANTAAVRADVTVDIETT